MGAQLAYYLLLSLFPFLIALLSILTFTPLAQAGVISQIMAIIPEDARVLIEPIIHDIIDSRSTALLSSSLFLAIWSGSTGIKNLMSAMNRAFNVERQRNFILQRLLAVASTVFLVLTIIIALLGQVFGRVIMDFLIAHIGQHYALNVIGSLARIGLPLVTMVLVFALMYRFAPSFGRGQHIGFRYALLGAVVTTLGWTAMSAGFNFYVSNFARFATTYGSLGGVIVLLIWLFITSMIIMVGAEVSAAYVAIRKAIPPPACSTPRPA